MNDAAPPPGFGARELFRFVRVKQPRVIDLARRVARIAEATNVLDAPKSARRKWARTFTKSGDRVRGIEDLAFPYFSFLGIEAVPEASLPSSGAISDLNAFRAARVGRDRRWLEDHRRCVLSLLAAKVLGSEAEVETLSRLLAFVDHFPGLDKVPGDLRYPPVLLDRTRFAPRPAPKADSGADSGEGEGGPASEVSQLRSLARDVGRLWDARNARLRAARRSLDEAIGNAARPSGGVTVAARAAAPSKAPRKKTRAGTAAAREAKASRVERALEYRRKRAEIQALKDAYRDLREDSSLAGLLASPAKVLVPFMGGLSEKEVASLQTQVGSLLGKYGVSTGKPCQVFDVVVTKADEADLPTYADAVKACFREFPRVRFDDDVRLLGTADLVRVEEEFIRYTPGEISYVETILAGEVRRREVKSEKYFEQLAETIREEVSELTDEASSKSTQELSSEIQNEISTRFESDVTAAMNASGGGTIGVVDVEGGASVNAGLGIGIDTSMATSNSSELSQEILKRAIERTKTATAERRLSRSYTLSNTLNYHEINNTVGDVRHRNGVYCFLDKHVLIKETVYGARVFLMANVTRPGRNLLCEHVERLRLNQLEVGRRPVFDITPDDVHPSTYKSLVGRYQATNVQPPPPPTTSLGRTYKTDTTNANVEGQEFNPGKVAKLLVPFFENYRRYLITDNIKLPEGYAVREVTVTVNHGGNGVSVPAHLPFSLAGAALVAGPSVMAGAAYGGLLLPYSLWQLAYLASPFLHYNTDSSLVTVSVGNESQDSPYYFFQPDFLIQEIFGYFGNFSAVGPGLLQTLQEAADTLIRDLNANAAAVPQEVAAIINAKVNDLVARVRALLTSVVNAIDLNPLDSEIATILTNINALAGSAVDLTTFNRTMAVLFQPLEAFIEQAFRLIEDAMQDGLADLFAFLTTMFDNAQVLPFAGAGGLEGELPVTLNTVSVKPGVTVNLTACLHRTERALDVWRLETFNALYQGYLQQTAEYESRAFVNRGPSGIRSPGLMRREEHLALKELVLHCLNNLHGPSGSDYTLENMNLFENAIDWNNMSYKLYNYGPNPKHIVLDKLGAFAGADDRRRSFLTAPWAQVLIPLQPFDHLERQVGQYFLDGTFDFEGDLADDELAALYRDLVLDRALAAEDPRTTIRTEVIPTDLVVINTEDLPGQLPVNEAALSQLPPS
jgi:hypothetical protein